MVAKALVVKYKVPMPNPGLRRDEVQQILEVLPLVRSARCAGETLTPRFLSLRLESLE